MQNFYFSIPSKNKTPLNTEKLFVVIVQQLTPDHSHKPVIHQIHFCWYHLRRLEQESL